ncbi:MAG: exonuclease domain-containing protein [Candidatus Paceibacterota bacterium]|jgi:exodeoxyribonuclease X
MKIIFFDTETTGNSDKDRLCQLGVKERYIEEPLVNALYKPPVPISIESMAIHHITEKMVAGRPAFQDAPEYGSVKDLFESRETLAVAHNAAFDNGMLAREGVTPRQTICTYKVAYALDPNDTLPNYRLQYLRYLLDLDVEAVAHDAWGDVLVLEALFERLLEKMKERHGTEEAALEAMLEVSSRPLLFTTLRFGKYNGKRIEDVLKTDRGYLEWLLGQKKQNPAGEVDWIYTLEHYLKNPVV